LGLVIFIILLAVIGGGGAWVWFFVYKQLGPQVETTLTKLLNRPIKLGKVESFSLNSLRFGATEVPTTPTDSDRASIQSVDVAFNPVPLLLRRTLELDVTLVKPNAYIDQSKDGNWVNTKLQSLEKGAIDVKLQVLRLRNADVVLVPRGAQGNPKTPVALKVSSGTVRFLNENKLIRLNLAGQLVNGGNFKIAGESRPSLGETNLALSGSDLGAAEIGRLIQLPLLLQAGKLNGNLEVNVLPNQPLQFLGTASLENVTARLAVLPKPFAKTNGQLRFKGTEVRLEKITTLFGQIPAQANGVLDTQSAINLSARTQPVQVKQVLQTFNFKQLPVAVSGEVQAALRVTGLLSKPIVSGEFASTKPTQIDRVNFRSVSASFGLVDSTASVNNLRAVPTVGGLVTGKGQVQLGQKGRAVFEAQATNVPGDAIARNYGIDLPVPIGSVSGRTQIFVALDNPQNPRAIGSANINVAGGTLRASNVQLDRDRFRAQVQAVGIQVERLAQVPPQLRGPLSGTFNLSGPVKSFNIAAIRGSGSGRLNIAGGTVNATDVELRNGGFTAQVEASGIRVERLAQLPPQLQKLQGPLSGSFNLSGPLTSFNIAAIRGSGSGRLNIAGGTVNATDVELRNGGFTAQVEAEGVRVERLAQLPPQLQELQGPLSGSFNLSGPLTSFNIAAIRGSGSGQLNIAGGTVNATNVELRNGAFIARVEAREVQVERLAQVPPQLRGFVSGTFNFSGPVTSFNLAAIRGSGSGQLNIADGTVNATDVQLRNGSFTARVRTEGVQLAGFSQDLQGRLGGNLNVSGSLTALSPSAIQARGQLNFSEGIALIDRPLTASISWNGQQLEIQQATANGFNANGVVNVNLANRGLQAIEGFNLNVRARDLNLQRLPAIVPNAVNLAGRADFEGRIAGTPTDPNVKGDLQLRDFVAGGLTFEPLLAGTVNAVPGQGVNLQLRGNEDRINVALAPNYQPVSFLVRTQGAVATGTRSGGELVVAVENFPIDTIKAFVPTSSLPAQTRTLAAQPLSGRLSGNLAVNLNTYGISGNVAIANPIFGTLRGDSFIGTIQYNNGVVALTNGEFKQGDNRYLLSANLTQTSKGPQFQAKLDVAQGELQDVLTALQIFDLSDLNRGLGAPTYGKAADVATAPAGLPQAPLQNQLRRLSEIEAILQQREESEAASPLPELAEAKGRFTGTVNVVGSLSSGISAEFNIQGQNWQWGPYSANEVIAQGGFQDGVLTLLPLRFQSGDRVANFAGTLGGDAQSGQLQLRNIPIDQLQAVLQKVTDLPPALTGFTGLLNATATLSGSVKNPQARGELTITDATLNQTPVQSAQGSFSYNNARLNFGSTVLVAQTDPLTISGSVPFKLPIASVEPENNQLNLDINVQNEGLALLNLLSGGQVTWLNGTGNVQLKVSGIIDPKTNRPTQLVAQGIAAVDKATIGARALPEALTNVTGNVLFDFDRILVQAVRGQFSGGTIAAAGTIPISQPASLENPLTVNIGELALNLKGLYRGGVRGNVTVTGTALAPELSGNVNLYNGQVQLLGAGGTTAGGTSTADGSVGGTPASSSNNTTGFKIGLSGLQLTLDRDIQLTLAPIVNFLAKGTLTVNGSLDNPSPEGTIRLERGQVNLFTTQFRLARDYENTARFVANRGRDPVVDVRLQAAVTEATQRRLPSDPLSAEISDTLTAANFGSVQTVRIQAKAQGPVSQLADNLELTSTPARSEAEIIALLGGSFVDTLGQGDSTLGLVNLAGSALLSNVQNAIGDALGLSEFRLFPTTIIDDKQRTSTLGLAAEAGVDITRSFSVSILKELTNDQPFQYSLRYRLSDKLLLRGSTDLSGDSRAVLEYENRF
jgi:translocation and assembly module TamB